LNSSQPCEFFACRDPQNYVGHVFIGLTIPIISTTLPEESAMPQNQSFVRVAGRSCLGRMQKYPANLDLQNSLLTEQEWYSPAQLAERLGVSVRTLADWRHEGKGPAYLVIGYRNVKYAHTDVEKWLKWRRKEPSHDREIITSRAECASPRGYVALPVQPERAGTERFHRFGRHRTKQESG
jgi:excisionase family DNA binding protein